MGERMVFYKLFYLHENFSDKEYSVQPLTAFYDSKSYDETFFRKAAGNQLLFRFHPFKLTKNTAETAEGAFAICAFVHDILDRPCLEKLKKRDIQLIAMRCAGFNYVDLEAARDLQIAVTRVPAYSPSAVAEHALALLLTLNRKIHRAYNRIREHNFSLEGLIGFNIAEKTVGIIGCGKIGKKTAQIFRGFEARVLAYDPAPDTQWAASHDVQLVDLTTLFKSCDIISLHLPLSQETEYLIYSETLAQMKPGVVLLNTSRGKLIHTAHLIEALRSGHVGAVALDVYEEEDALFYQDRSQEILNDEQLAYLLTFPNVLVTAHQAFLTQEALTEISTTTVRNILAFYEGHPLQKDTILVAPNR
jgi:D-lactate dehydrogenase